MSTARVVQLEAVSAPARDNLPIGYLRAFVTLLVIAHHAVLAYHPFAPGARTSLLTEEWWKAFPIVDAQRSMVFALLVGWNDTFFMALMFFLSGLFVARSLARKGARSFLMDRLVRLGLPFVACAAILSPLAYYPAYLTTPAPAGIGDYVHTLFSLSSWPAGPAWFLWVLLAFGIVAALFQTLRPGWDVALGERLSVALERPGRSFGLLVLLSAAVYLPMTFAFNPMYWTAVGPFAFQTSRLFLYGLYFFAGVLLGAHGLERTLLTMDGRLSRRWLVWSFAALGAFALSVGAAIVAFSPGAGRAAQVASGVAFVVSCAASSFALTAVFLRFARTRTAAGESLRENAYGMYLVHYVFSSWLQLALVAAPLPALVKGLIVFLAVAALSWGTTAALRRVPAFQRVL